MVYKGDRANFKIAYFSIIKMCILSEVETGRRKFSLYPLDESAPLKSSLR